MSDRNARNDGGAWRRRVSKWDVERAVMRDTRGKEDRAWILAIPPLPAPARHVMHALLSRADADTAVVSAEFAPSLTELAALTGLDRSTVRRQLNHIEETGWTIRHRPDVRDARTKGVTTWYELRIPGVGAERPHLEAPSPQVGAENPGGGGTVPPIPSPDLSDLDQSKAAAGSESDQRGEGEPDPRVREILTAANLGLSWEPGIIAALSAGHPQAAIVHELTKPRKGARDIARVRWVALRDLATTRPDVRTATPEDPAKGEPEDLYAAVATEFGPARPVPELPRLRRGQDPTTVAGLLGAVASHTDPRGPAMRAMDRLTDTTRPQPPDPAPAEHDPHACMGCGKAVPRSVRPWVEDDKLVLYCVICRTGRRRRPH